MGVEPTCHFSDAGLANLWLTIRRTLPFERGLVYQIFAKCFIIKCMADMEDVKKTAMENDVEKIMEDINDEKVLFEWEAPERAYQKRDRDFWITAVAILVLVSVILIFVKEYFLVVALGSVLFLYYGLATVPPNRIKNKITNRGICFGELRYVWDDLENFHFKTSLSNDQILFGTMLRFPRQVAMVIDTVDKEKLKSIVVKKIPYVETPPRFIDKLTKWFADRLPLEKREK